MQFKEFASYLEKLEKISSRNEMTEVLCQLFKEVDVEEVDNVSYLLLGCLAPEFKGIVFNIAEKVMVRIFAKAYGVADIEVVSEYKLRGDLGEVAFAFAKKQSAKVEVQNQSVSEIYNDLWEIASVKGEGSVESKVEKTKELLKNVDPVSAKFIVRITLGKLRLGFSDKTILDALSYLETGDKGGKKELETAYNVLPDVGYLAKRVKEVGIKKTVSTISPKVGYPMLPMLPARLKSPVEMIKKMGKVFVEPKFDGLRIQIHYKESGLDNGNKVKAFTRKPNEVSLMFPELGSVGKYLKAKEVILDSEAVGVDEIRKSMVNFQTTMGRRRKHDIEEMAKKVSIKFNVFDVMYIDGKSLIDTPYEERRKVLNNAVKNGDLLKIVDFEITQDPERINELMRKELGEGLEGIIVKKADAGYVAGRTGYRWVKMKEKESQKAKLADSLDCIVMGYYKGRGKRTSFGVGGFLVGVINDTMQSTKGKQQRVEEGRVLTLTKIGTGLTDDQFRELKRRLLDLEVKDKPKNYGAVDNTVIPDVWVIPGLVIEVAADEITASDKSSSGYSLRFPRLVKFRDDKDWTGATTLNEVKKLFKMQKS
jgi:DNA ligase 1